MSLRKRIWGWFFFDWASQPYNTLIITFIFAPYFRELYVAEGIGDSADAQAYWGFATGLIGLVIALSAPVLGAISDISGNRLRWIWLFSAMYVVGSAMLWFAAPGSFDLFTMIVFFGIGMIGMEFATIFTDSMLPDLGTKEEIGRISGNGWAFGYLGGLLTLVLMLVLFAENSTTGKTLIGMDPILGLDAGQREGTRFVGPLTAIWYAVFMIPFFLYVRDTPVTGAARYRVGQGLSDLWVTLKNLPRHPSLLAYLGSSMFYRDALNGMYTFGGIYALGVLNWSIIDIGVFGILAAISGAVFCWVGGRVDRAIGPMPVIVTCCLILIATAVLIISLTPNSIMGITLAEGSSAPDIAFYIAGALIGAAGGALQASSRNMLTRQGNPDRMTEAFGLYALSGKATSFLAPALIAIASDLSGSQRIGIAPVVGLFIIGLVLLVWVKPNGDFAK